ncbi:MAG TPA: hypothetical protein VKH41_04555 [Myxococcota bacterium]|nr:hypothetical protein [Myxococcota bacterium]
MTMFPPLLIPVNANPSRAIVKQTNGADPKQMTVPVGAFYRKPVGALVLGVSLNNPTVYQVRTNIEFSGPAPLNGSAVFKAGGRPGAAVTTHTGPPKSVLFPGKIRYSKTANQFGGASRTKVVPLSVVKAWAHGPTGNPPCKHSLFGGTDSGCIGIIVEAHPMTLAVAGAMTGVVDTTPGGVATMSGVQAVSVPKKTGLIAKAVVVGSKAPISNMATSAGFPWTTGMLTISQPSAAGTPEVFTITGMDTRMNGVGTISLVSGALSDRVTSGANSNRSWARYTLPEPGAVLGAAAALAMLGVCHGLVRRRNR